MKKVAILILFMLGCAISEGYAQKVALKSNLLYHYHEFGVGDRTGA